MRQCFFFSEVVLQNTKEIQTLNALAPQGGDKANNGYNFKKGKAMNDPACCVNEPTSLNAQIFSDISVETDDLLEISQDIRHSLDKKVEELLGATPEESPIKEPGMPIGKLNIHLVNLAELHETLIRIHASLCKL